IFTALIFIGVMGQSHSSEPNEKRNNLFIPSSLSEVSCQEQAVKFWNEHLNSNIDRDAVREKFSKIFLNYKFLLSNRFDVLDPNAKDVDVFTNISFLFYAPELENFCVDPSASFNEIQMMKIIRDLSSSQVTDVSIEGNL